MYIWIGCAVPEDIAAPLRAYCLECNRSLGLSTVAFTLPQHISLKISFSVDEPEPVLDYLESTLSLQSRFEAGFTEVSRLGSILWCSVDQNPRLQQLHQQLDTLLQTHWGVTPHPFDLDFQFHSTLFLDSDEGKLEQMCSLLQRYPLPETFPVTTCLLGTSPDGTPGSYQVVRKFNFL